MNVVHLDLSELPRIREFAHAYIRPNYPVVREQFFRWQYVETARLANSPHIGIAATEAVDGRLSALWMSHRAAFHLAGKRVEGAWLHEWYNTPAAGNAGFFLLLDQLNGASVLGVMGQSLSAANLFLRARPALWFELERLVFVFDPRVVGTWLSAPTESALRILQIFSQPRSSSAAKLVETFDDEYQQVWDGMAADIALATDRDKETMTWRYLRHPSFRYQVALVRATAGTAFFVWREEPVSGGEGMVARLCDAIGSPEAVAQSVGAVLALIGERGAAMADFFCSNARLVEAMVEGGMLPVVSLADLDLPRLFSPLSADPRRTINVGFSVTADIGAQALRRYRSSYVTKGDSNQDRPNL